MSFDTPFFSEDNSRQNRPCVVFVEGQDDAFFLSALLAEIAADPLTFGIVQVKGKEKFPAHLGGFFKSPNFTQGVTKTVLIVCDADGDPKKVEAQIGAVLTAAQQPFVSLGQYVTNAKGVKIGLFTMPNTTTPGDLESLCLETVADHPVAQTAESFIAVAEAAAVADGKKLNGSRHKRKAQVYLAGMPNEPVRGAGRGYALGCFRAGHPALEPLRAFLLEPI